MDNETKNKENRKVLLNMGFVEHKTDLFSKVDGNRTYYVDFRTISTSGDKINKPDKVFGKVYFSENNKCSNDVKGTILEEYQKKAIEGVDVANLLSKAIEPEVISPGDSQPTAIAVREEQRQLEFVDDFKGLKSRFNKLQEFVKDIMKDKEDYGIIPGTHKPTLFKAGAEKICTAFGLAPIYETIDKEVNWDKPFFRYQVRCNLLFRGSEQIVGSSEGACNSFEKQYYDPKTGKYKGDSYALDNTVLKMAQKRALVAAVLNSTAASSIFTQDLEDIKKMSELHTLKDLVEHSEMRGYIRRMKDT